MPTELPDGNLDRSKDPINQLVFDWFRPRPFTDRIDQGGAVIAFDGRAPL